MSRSLESRVERLEERTPAHPGLAVLEAHELVALVAALQQKNPAVREARLAAIDLCPRSEQALIDFIAHMQEQSEGKS